MPHCDSCEIPISGRLCRYFKALSQNSDAIMTPLLCFLVLFVLSFCAVYCWIYYHCWLENKTCIIHLIKPVTLGLEGAATEQTYLQQRRSICASKCNALLHSDHVVKTRVSTVQQNWKQRDCGGILLFVERLWWDSSVCHVFRCSFFIVQTLTFLHSNVKSWMYRLCRSRRMQLHQFSMFCPIA